MKKIITALKNTLIRGIVFTVPILVLLIVIDKALDKLKELANPIADVLPYHSFFGIGKAYWAVFLIFIFVGLFMGLIARLRVATNLLNWLEENLLIHIPGYSFMKQIFESILGAADDEKTYKVVLFSIEEAWQLAYVIEEISENMVALYVPSTPNPREGDVFYVSKDRIRPTTISYKDSLKLAHAQGRGSKKILQGLF